MFYILDNVPSCNTSIHTVWKCLEIHVTSDRSGSPEESPRKNPYHPGHISTALEVLRELRLCHVLVVCIYDTTKSITGCKC